MNAILIVGLWVAAQVITFLAGISISRHVEPRRGEQAGHIFKTIFVVHVIFFLAFVLAYQTQGPDWLKWAFLASAAWTGLTLVFEFIIARLVFNEPWEVLIADYNLAKGRLWAFVALAYLVSAPAAGAIFASL